MEVCQRIMVNMENFRGFGRFCSLRVQKNMEIPDVHAHWWTCLYPNYKDPIPSRLSLGSLCNGIARVGFLVFSGAALPI